MIALLLSAAALPALDCSGTPALRESGFCAPAETAPREKLPPPGMQMRMNQATATRAPWVDSNGWRFLRNPGGRYRYVLPAGKAALAAAEAFAYGADAVLQIDPRDLPDYRRMRAFLERVQAPPLPPRANIAVVDDGSDYAGEVLNLLARRNLLFQVVKAPASGYDLTLRIPKEAVDPDEVAARARRELGDAKRLVRVYGSEVVLVRLTGDRSKRRLHLLNYSQLRVEGLRVRVLGLWPKVSLAAYGYDGARVEDVAAAEGATEFSIPEMGVYAVADLTR